MSNPEEKPTDQIKVRAIDHIQITDYDTGNTLVSKRGEQPKSPIQNHRDELKLRSFGHVHITDAETGEVFLDNYNALHPENLSEALALCLADRGYGNIHQMVFGSGASTISGTGAITYFPPNTSGADAQLYYQTFAKVVDDNSPQNTDTTQNYLTVNHTQGNPYTDVVVTCRLERTDGNGQSAFDDASDADDDFVFDEIGLMTYNSNTSLSRLIGHIVFSPVQKSLNRALVIRYTIRIYLGA